VIYNNSSLVDAGDCLRLYFNKHIRRLGLKFEEGLPGFSDRFEGVLWHAIMAEHYSHGEHFGIGVSAVIDDAYKASYEAATLEEEIAQLDEKRSYFSRLYDAYASYYIDDSDRWDILGIEEQFITPLGDFCRSCGAAFDDEIIRGLSTPATHSCGEAIRFLVGQLDLRIREDGIQKIVDHKSKRTSVSEWYLGQFVESTQFTQYLYGARRNFGGDVSCGIANVVAKLKLIDKKGQPFHRNNEIIRGLEDFAVFVDERRSLVESLEARAKLQPSVSLWPRNASQCRRFGLCGFHGLCFPARLNILEIPYDLEDTYEQKEAIHIDNYAKLVEEEVR